MEGVLDLDEAGEGGSLEGAEDGEGVEAGRHAERDEGEGGGTEVEWCSAPARGQAPDEGLFQESVKVFRGGLVGVVGHEMSGAEHDPREGEENGQESRERESEGEFPEEAGEEEHCEREPHAAHAESGQFDATLGFGGELGAEGSAADADQGRSQKDEREHQDQDAEEEQVRWNRPFDPLGEQGFDEGPDEERSDEGEGDGPAGEDGPGADEGMGAEETATKGESDLDHVEAGPDAGGQPREPQSEQDQAGD